MVLSSQIFPYGISEDGKWNPEARCLHHKLLLSCEVPSAKSLSPIFFTCNFVCLELDILCLSVIGL